MLSEVLADETEALSGFEKWRAILRTRTLSVGHRYQTGTYICGRPGIGKTHTVRVHAPQQGSFVRCHAYSPLKATLTAQIAG